MFAQIESLLPVFAQTVIIYLFLIFGFRIFGRRQLGQLTVFDLVILLVLGSAVEVSLVNGDMSLKAGLVSAGALLATNRLFNAIAVRSTRFRHLCSCEPVVLVNRGHYVEENLRRTGLTVEDVLEAVREREFETIDDVRFAVLEADGSIHVISMATKLHEVEL